MSFTKLDPTDFVVSSDAVTAPAWSSNVPTLTTFFTASAGLVTSSFYLDVYNTASSNINAAVQFSIAYGQLNGTASVPFNALVPGNTPTRVNYGQYRNIVYGDNETYFNFGTGMTASSDIFSIQIDRNRYKEALMTGTFNLKLTNGGSSLYLTENSADVSTIQYLDCGRVYNIVSGSNGSSQGVALASGAPQAGYTQYGAYGLFLPDIGLIVLNPSALSQPVVNGGLNISINSVAGTSADNQANNRTMYNLIKTGASFQLNSKETISSDYIFVRIKNGEYNYSTNPSYITGSGNLAYSDFIYNSQTYITTVGMYNQNNELLAVAKLSKPLVKDFTKEALLRVKLDW